MLSCLLGVSTYARAELRVITAPTTIGSAEIGYENDEVVVDGAVLTIEGTHTFASLSLQNGAVLTHSLESTQPPAITAAQLTIDTTSRIDVSNLGELRKAGATDIAGGSYGGRGGDHRVANNGLAAPAYGDFRAPVELGSGGYGNTRGAGAVKLIVNDLIIDGQILAGGQHFTSSYVAGGSGGSIWIEVGTLSGTGLIDASGGDGYQGSYYQGAGGGGGRIAIYYSSVAGFDFNTQVINHGGRGTTSSAWGGAGSVYLKADADPLGLLLIDNGSASSDNTGATEVASLPEPIIVRNGGRLETAVGVTLGNVELLAGSRWEMPTAVDSNSPRIDATVATLVVDATSKIDVSYRGLLKSAEATDISAGSHGGRGGSHRSANSGTSNPTYGDYRAPVDLGTGGYGNTRGGGAAKIVADALVLEGEILARGESTSTTYNAGGSGGSIWLDVGELSGSGRIDASGGDGYQSSYYQGAGGGGGRIAIYYDTLAGFDFDAQIDNLGGRGTGASPWGGAGTVYLKKSTDSNGEIHVDNGSAPISNAAAAEIAADGARLLVRNSTRVKVEPGSSFEAVELRDGARWTMSLANTQDSDQVDASIGRLVIDATSKLDVSARGILRTADVTDISAGSYGGRGGDHRSNNNGTSNPVYGDYRTPRHHGTGGYGTRGAGAIKITADQILLEGEILARGESGAQVYNAGGSGGSIWLDVGELSGSGRVDAGGGDGYPSTYYQSAGGGGGRVAIHYDDASGFNFDTQVVNRGGAGGGAAPWGGAGTVFLKAALASTGEVRIDNGDSVSLTNAGSTDVQLIGDRMIVRNNTRLVARAGTTLGDVELRDGAWWTILPAIDQSSEKLDVSLGKLFIDAKSRIDVAGRGLERPATVTGRSAGSHGGLGGDHSSGTSNPVYGDYRMPADHGSGGYGTRGGGAVKLTAVEIVLDGTISARGETGTNSYFSGGSGGSIWIDVGIISGGGLIDARGGDGMTSYAGAGGGGGRIALYYSDASEFDLSTQVLGHGGNGTTSTPWGGAGSVYLKMASDPVGELRIDNGSIAPITPAGAAATQVGDVPDRLVARANTRLLVATGSTVGELELRDGAWWAGLPAQDQESSKLEATIGRLTIDAASKLDVSGMGLPRSPEVTVYSAGSYGGRGGDNQGVSNPTYGDYRMPVDFGTGGNGARGGGAIKLNIDELALDGKILARGESAPNIGRNAGGSGGSIWLTAGMLSGTGVIDAGGGDGSPYAGYLGVGGGGGRVAIYYVDSGDFDLSSQVVSQGGKSLSATRQWGGAGSVYLRDVGDALGELRIDNGDAAPTTLKGAAATEVGSVPDPLVARGSTRLVVAPGSVLQDVELREGALWTGAQAQSQASEKVDARLERLTIDATSSLDVSGTGLPRIPEVTVYSAGSYAGRGGANRGVSNPTYGDYRMPVDFGTGGNGSRGGGAIKLSADELVLDGKILARGEPAPNVARNAGGSGGSVWLDVGTLSGTGVIDASGGDGSPYSGYLGVGGGGGRIAVYYGDSGEFDLRSQISNLGGKSLSLTKQWGGAGSVYLKDTGEALGELRIDNGDSAPLTPTGAADAEVGDVPDHLVARGTTRLVVAAGSVLRDVELREGALWTGAQAQTQASEKVDARLERLTIDATSSLDVSGTGLPRIPEVTVYSAGSYAGRGGANQGVSNPTYGDYRMPVDFGTGGNGSRGGGAIKLSADELVLDGKILARGESAPNVARNAGGSGGSVWLDVGTLSGTGVIDASGGDGSPYTNYLGVGGGGGRIAVYYGDSGEFDLRSQISNLGGKSLSVTKQWGGAGTTFIKQRNASDGMLYVDNMGASTAIAEAARTEIAGASDVLLHLTRARVRLLDDPVSLIRTDGDGESYLEAVGKVTGNRIDLNGVALTHPVAVNTGSNRLEIEAKHLVIGANAAIDVSGTGLGATGLSNYAGGSYGGKGGGGSNAVYGDPLAPYDFGSGGHSNMRGGGAVRITANQIELEGDILALGTSASTSYQSGGSGGSVWLDVGVLSGPGQIDASGGNAAATGATAGGGGGRIAIYYSDAGLFALGTHVRNSGGGPPVEGEPGSIHTQSKNEPARVLTAGPEGLLTEPVTQLSVRFNTGIDSETFALSDIALDGPSGAITPTGVVQLSTIDYRIDFAAALDEDGIYSMRLGPDIQTLGGQSMDQDDDNVPGEPVEDVFSLSFELDSIAPAPPVITSHPISPAVSASATRSITLEGTREDGTSIWVNGIQRSTEASGAWAASFVLNEGTPSVSVSARDAAGYESTPVALEFLIDTRAPRPGSVVPANGSYVSAVPASVQFAYYETGSGIDAEASTLTLINDSLDVTGELTDSGGALVFTPALPLIEGQHHLSVTFADNVGHVNGPFSRTFTIDQTVPATPTVDPTPAEIGVADLTLRGTKEANSGIWLNGTRVVAPSSGTAWTHAVVLASGENLISISSQDRAGNESGSVERSIEFDDAAPGPVTISIDPDGRGTTASIHWDTYDEFANGNDIARYDVYSSTVDFTEVTTATLSGSTPSGIKQIEIQGLARDTTHFVAVVAVDEADNSTSSVSTQSFLPNDVVAPADVTDLEVIAAHTELTITWTAPEDSDADLAAYTAYIDGSGTPIVSTETTYTWPGLGAASVHAIRLTSIDTDSNESEGAEATGITLLPNPTGLSVEPGSGLVSLAWTGAEPSEHVQSYALYVDESEFSDVLARAPRLTVASTRSDARIAGLENGTEYWFAITTINRSGGEDPAVIAVSATPEPDTDGPELTDFSIDGNPIVGGETVTGVAMLSAMATDPSGVSRLEFLVDDSVVATDTSGSDGYSGIWDIHNVTDTAHSVSVIAYDTLDHSTRVDYSVTVALAPPGAPTVSAPTDGYTTNDENLAVAGSVDPHSQVQLYLDGIPVGSLLDGDDGEFSASLLLSDGDNEIQAGAVNRGGSSGLSAVTSVTLDTELPAAPVGLSASARADGVIRLRWQPSNDAGISGYHVYRSSTPFDLLGHADRANSELVTGRIYDDLPSTDSTYYYRVVSVEPLDSGEVLSTPSTQASATADSVMPHGSLVFDPEGSFDETSGRMGVGLVSVTLTVSEPLVTAPFLTITPGSGIPIPIQLYDIDDLTYQGSFEIDETTPDGSAFAVFSARDLAGNRGTELDAGATLELDPRGPVLVSLSVVPEEPIENSESEPVTVNFVLELDEPVGPGETPELSYLLSADGRTAQPIGSLVRVDATTWQGGFALPADAGLAAPETFAFQYRGVDDLGNESAEVAAFNQYQVYQGDLPPLPVPVGLTATALADGDVRLAWEPVDGAVLYQLYRQSPAETKLSAHERPSASPFVDVSPSDGEYWYAVASVRQHNAKEAISAQTSAVSVTVDSTPPNAPENFVITLLGTGGAASWDAPLGAEPISYRLYRGDVFDFDIATATLVLDALPETIASDANPSDIERFYRVVAVDEAKNVSEASNSAHLGFALLPVANLQAERTNDADPVITWTHNGSGIAGFNVYLLQGSDRIKLNTSPLADPTYTDSGYVLDSRRYAVVAEDLAGIESAERRLSLPAITAVLADGEGLERHVVNILDYDVINDSDRPVSGVRLKLDIEGRSYRSDEFSLGPEESDTISLVIGGHADLPDLAATTVSIEIDPVPGESVRIREDGELLVTDATGLVLGLATEDFVRGGSGSVRFTLENAGDLETEVIVSEGLGSASSRELRFEIVDEDDNLLAFERVHQFDGADVHALANGKVVARIPPGGVFTSKALTMDVPGSAPDQVKVRFVVDKVHYRLGQADHVAIEGPTRTIDASLVDTAYVGTVDSVTPSHSDGNTDIVIEGRARSRVNSDPLAGVSLDVVIASNGFERQYDVNTDANGAYQLDFTPLPGESGHYTVSAVHPDLNERPIHAQFTIGRLQFSPSIINLRTSRNYDQTIAINALAGAGATATNLRLSLDAEDQPGERLPIGVTATLPEATSIENRQSTLLDVIIRADDTAPATGTLVLRAMSDEGGNDPLTLVRINFTFEEAIPVLSVQPSFIETGVAQQDAVSESVVLKNIGLADTDTVIVKLLTDRNEPAPSWIHLASSEFQAPVAIGEERAISINLNPSNAVTDGIYEFKLRVLADGNVRDIPIYVMLTSSGLGTASFHLSDIYTATIDPSTGTPVQGLEGATLHIQNERNSAIDHVRVTDGFGEVLFEDLPAGWYKFKASAENHQEVNGRLFVKAGMTMSRQVFLNFNLISVEWSVKEITIEDRYEIVLSATYETNVPAAVVTVDPPSLSMPSDMKPGDVFYGQFTLTNQGLIRADHLEVALPTSNDYFRFELIEGLPTVLAAHEQVRVAYRAIMLNTVSPGAESETSGGGCGGFGACLSGLWDWMCANGTEASGEASHCVTILSGDCGGGGDVGIGGRGGFGGFKLSTGGHGSDSSVREINVESKVPRSRQVFSPATRPVGLPDTDVDGCVPELLGDLFSGPEGTARKCR